MAWRDMASVVPTTRQNNPLWASGDVGATRALSRQCSGATGLLSRQALAKTAHSGQAETLARQSAFVAPTLQARQDDLVVPTLLARQGGNKAWSFPSMAGFDAPSPWARQFSLVAPVELARQ